MILLKHRTFFKNVIRFPLLDSNDSENLFWLTKESWIQFHKSILLHMKWGHGVRFHQVFGSFLASHQNSSEILFLNCISRACFILKLRSSFNVCTDFINKLNGLYRRHCVSGNKTAVANGGGKRPGTFSKLLEWCLVTPGLGPTLSYYEIPSRNIWACSTLCWEAIDCSVHSYVHKGW